MVLEILVPVSTMSVIQQEVPYELRSKFVPIVERGYKIARAALNGIPFLDWEIGRFHEGYLRPIAIQYLFQREISLGRLEVKCSIESNSKKTAKYLQLHTDSAIITISQVQSLGAIARHAYYRKKMQEANQYRFDFFDENSRGLIQNQPHYLLLTHGYGSSTPDFINLGMPNGYRWIEEPINLLKEPRLVVNDEKQEAEEVIKPELLVEFREFVQEVEEGEK